MFGKSRRQAAGTRRVTGNALTSAVRPVIDSLEKRSLMSAGDLDTTFAGTGFVVENLDGLSEGWAVAVDTSTNKIIAGGHNGSQIALLRYLSNGTPDPTFDGDGVFTTQININNENEDVQDVLLVGGQILVTGTLTDDDTGDADIYLMRLNDDGTVASINVYNQPGVQVASEMTADADGNVYIVGTDGSDAFVLKTDAAGTPDAGFGSGGFATVDFGGESFSSIALQANGAGTADDQVILGGNIDGDAVLARINGSDGSIDTTYGPDDTGVSELIPLVTYRGIAIAADNSVFGVTETFGPGGNVVMAVRKYDADGSLVDAFDGDGEAIADTGLGFTATGYGVTLAGSQVIAVGFSSDDNTGNVAAIVARWDATTGVIDAGFGNAGIASVNAQDINLGFEVAVDGNGDIVIVGATAPADASSAGFLTARIQGADDAPPVTPVHVDGNGDLIIPGTSGNDVFSVVSEGSDVRVFYNSINAGVFSFSGVIRATGLAGDDSITIANDVSANSIITGGIGNDTITGGGGNDSITGGADNDVISGQSGDDTLRGNAGTDSLNGGDDNDDIHGGADSDTSIGGNGNDSIANDGGDDELTGGAGDDTLRAGGGADEVHGDSGNDSILGGVGNDSLFGDGDNDTINGGAGDDFIDGGSGNDDLNGQGGSDIVLGGIGNDTVQGGAERDILIGGDNADSIIGNADEDILIAGTTTHDGNQATLSSALATWNGPGTYASRVATLGSTTFRTSGIITVFDDGDVDTLAGGAGTDWFLFNSDPGAIDLTDIKPAETGTDID